MRSAREEALRLETNGYYDSMIYDAQDYRIIKTAKEPGERIKQLAVEDGFINYQELSGSDVSKSLQENIFPKILILKRKI